MHKREQREEQRRLDEQRRKRAVTRNWIIAIISLMLAFLCYSFNDAITNFFQTH